MNLTETEQKKKSLHCRLGYHPNWKYDVGKPDIGEREGKTYWVGKVKVYCVDCGIFMHEETWH